MYWRVISRTWECGQKNKIFFAQLKLLIFYFTETMGSYTLAIHSVFIKFMWNYDKSNQHWVSSNWLNENNLLNIICCIYFFKDFIYLLLEGKGEKHQCVVASHVPFHWGLGQQPRRVPWLEIELVTLWSAGWCSIHWATPARALFLM